MEKIRKVVKYQASDGTLFDSIQDAEVYEEVENSKKCLRSFVEYIHFNGMTEGDLYEDLLEHAEDLYKILGGVVG